MRATSLLPLLLLPMTWGCDSPITPDREPATIAVTPSSVNLAPNGTAQLVAQTWNGRGELLNETFTWTSSSPGIASVNASGVVTGVADGNTAITASAGSVHGIAQVFVTTPPPPPDPRKVAIISVLPTSATIRRGETVQLAGRAWNSFNQEVRDALLTWTSLDPTWASVDQGGLVTGLARGVATIRASSGDAVADVRVTVTDTLPIPPAPPEPSPPNPGGPGGFSCPLVYSWDGQEWHLDSGTFGGAIARGLARTDVDILEHAVASGGRLHLRMTNELSETEHVDAVEVVAVDHAPGTLAVPDPSGGIHVVRPFDASPGARDFDGREASGLVARADGRAWESVVRLRDPSKRASLRDGLELSFRRPMGAARAWLVIDAQNTPWATGLLGALVEAQGGAVGAGYWLLGVRPIGQAFQRRVAREAFLHISLATGNRWTDQGFLWEAGPEVMKRQAVLLDLTGVTGDIVRVRLSAPPSFWRIDAVALALDPTATAVPPGGGESATGKPVALLAARSGGRDRRPLLAEIDRRDLTMETGDTVDLVFVDAPRTAAIERTYFLRSTGWYRIHSRAHGFPDLMPLARLAWDRDGMARMAVERGNAALRAAARGRYARH